MDEYYMKIALEEAKKSFENNEVPIGCVITDDSSIVAQSHNMMKHKKNPLYHAELLALKAAIKKTGNCYLENCTMYVTVEPCLMCIGAIAQTRIKKIVYAASNSKFGYSVYIGNIKKIMNHSIEITCGICENESVILMKKFFENKRR